MLRSCNSTSRQRLIMVQHYRNQCPLFMDLPLTSCRTKYSEIGTLSYSRTILHIRKKVIYFQKRESPVVFRRSFIKEGKTCASKTFLESTFLAMCHRCDILTRTKDRILYPWNVFVYLLSVIMRTMLVRVVGSNGAERKMDENVAWYGHWRCLFFMIGLRSVLPEGNNRTERVLLGFYFIGYHKF